MNPNWSKWIFASISKHFNAGKGDIAAFHIQGTVRNFKEDVERGEFRWTGADFDQQTKGFYKTDFTINILISVPLGKDNHRIHKLVGRFAALCEASILVKKYGDGDDTIGCLQLKGQVQTHDWGQIHPEIKVTQSSVECDYTIQLEN